MAKQTTLAFKLAGVRTVEQDVRACRKRVVARLKALPPGPAIPAVAAGRELILRGCRTCGGCWMGRL